MAAFERIQSGIPEMDQALADKRNLIYIRFANHEPFVEKQEGSRSMRWSFLTNLKPLPHHSAHYRKGRL